MEERETVSEFVALSEFVVDDCIAHVCMTFVSFLVMKSLLLPQAGESFHLIYHYRVTHSLASFTG